MSGLAKALKKTFVGALKPVRKLASKATEVVKKVVKSKAFKVIAGAALIYFGGAAVMSMVGGGTASAGIGSAWGGLQGAGSALAKGQIGGAFSALGSGFTSGATAGAAGTFATGQAAAQSAISANLAGVAAGGAGATLQAGASPTSTSLVTPGLESMKAGAKLGLDTTAQSLVGQTTKEVAKTGLLAGLGDATKAAMVTSGVNMAGQMIQGYSQQKQAEEQAANRDYFGVNGKGERSATAMPGLLNPSNIMPGNPVPQLQPLNSLDALIERKQQEYNSTYKQWGA